MLPNRLRDEPAAVVDGTGVVRREGGVGGGIATDAGSGGGVARVTGGAGVGAASFVTVSGGRPVSGAAMRSASFLIVDSTARSLVAFVTDMTIGRINATNTSRTKRPITVSINARATNQWDDRESPTGF
jgi:hypothetical protein